MRSPAGKGALVMAVAILFALAYVFIIRQPAPVPVPAARSVTGTFVWTLTEKDPAGSGTVVRAERETGSFSAASGGGGNVSYRLTRTGTEPRRLQLDIGYDAASRTQTTTRIASKTTTVREVGTWAPAWRLGGHTPLDLQGLSAVVRSAAEDGDHAIGIKSYTDGGRKVWRAALKLPGGWVIELSVDQQSGLVTWYAATGPGADAECGTVAGYSQEEMITKIDWTATAVTPASLPQATAATTLTDKRVTYHDDLAAAARALGVATLKPTLLPDGYRLQAIATRYRWGGPQRALVASADSLSTAGPTEPPNEIDLLYTRGLCSAVITLRHLDAASLKTARSWESSLGGELGYETDPVQYGMMTGSTAHTWFSSGDGPVLYERKGTWAMLVRGSLTRQELLSVSEGLKQLR